ncbi:MAG: WD40 repeat domain-containing protein [Deltaproteobacteria bacterium]|nr:WD40 repeat domain-containing protein [Deltaproteobacteria bacterium]
MRRVLCCGLVLLVVGLHGALSCGGEGDAGGAAAAPGSSGSQGGGVPNGGAGGAGGDLFNTGGQPGYTLAVEPPTATIVVEGGASAPAAFKALLDGNPTAAKWSVDLPAVAAVDQSGVVTATNAKGGEVILTAEAAGLKAEATIAVLFKATANPGNIGPADQAILKAASDVDGAAQWTYPYNKTVFPKGLLPPELMWNGTGPSDEFYVHFKSPFADLEVFTLAPPPSRFALDPEAWKVLTESGKGPAVDVTVARLQPGQPTATVVAAQSWKIAPGSLRGTVYYWANSVGRVVRIKPGANAPDDFLAAAGVQGCSTCHTVSANGQILVIGGDVPTSTFDLVTNQSVLSLGQVGKAVRNWAFPAVSPDGKYLVENNAPLPGPPGGSDGMWDTHTGQKILGTGLDGVWLNMPSFGPAGTKLGYVSHSPPYDLWAYDYDANANKVSNPVLLVAAGNDPSLNCIAFPSVSPTIPTGQGDKTWIVYHRGVWPGSLDTRSGPGDLYLASADKQGLEIRLAAANGDGYPFAAGDRDRHYNYEPTFAPANAGGFFWVVFTSRRTRSRSACRWASSARTRPIAAIRRPSAWAASAGIRRRRSGARQLEVGPAGVKIPRPKPRTQRPRTASREIGP